MGCCLSRTAESPSAPSPTPSHLVNKRHANIRSRLPPPPPEEETVKEVLTQTPFPETTRPAVENKSLDNSKSKEDDVVEIEEKQRNDGFEIQKSADIEVSEITTENRSVAAAVSVSVSVSESVSVGGVEKRGCGGGGDEVMSKSRDIVADVNRRQRSTTSEQSPVKVLKRRPYSGEQTLNGERGKRVRSPAKRTVCGPAPSPEKKMNTHSASRAARGRSQSPATSNPRTGMNTGPARIRRDSGERSGRRSKSPARVHITRSLTEVNDKINGGQPKQEEVRRTETVQETEDTACRPADESLDNPLVSLECFIFL